MKRKKRNNLLFIGIDKLWCVCLFIETIVEWALRTNQLIPCFVYSTHANLIRRKENHLSDLPVLLCFSMVNVPPFIEPSSKIYFYHMSRLLVSQIITVKGMKS